MVCDAHEFSQYVISFISETSACEKAQQWEQALGLLPEMRCSQLEPDAITYSAAISACEKALKGQQCEQALKSLQDCAAPF